MMTEDNRFNIGIIGGGVVGGGVAELLETNDNITIVGICVKNKNKDRDWKTQKTYHIVDDPYLLINNPEIDMIVEVMGGTDYTFQLITDSIKQKKHIVTANKALISKYLVDIIKLVDKHQVEFGYEAAVCGGIPIIHTLQRDFVGDNITKISGIINGTTNYILSTMENSPEDFSDILKQAQEKGYAETDPTADIMGYDVRSKISILTKLSYGTYIPENMIHTKGITDIKSIDFEYAKLLNSTIKMIGISKLNSNNLLEVYVTPMVVNNKHIYSNISGPKNIVEIESDNLNSTVLIGDGAGRYPTANSIVSDIISIVNKNKNTMFPLNTDYMINGNYTSYFYIRIIVKDSVGIILKIGELFKENNISVDSIQQLQITDSDYVPFVITTNETTIDKMNTVCIDINLCEFVLEECLFMPIFT